MRRMMEANRSQVLRQASATPAASANARFARRLPFGYWNTVSIGLSSGLSGGSSGSARLRAARGRSCWHHSARSSTTTPILPGATAAPMASRHAFLRLPSSAHTRV